MASTGATEHRIFHVTELLEAILHELPMQDVLLVMRVCKTWKQTIDNSTKLQKDLFLLGEAEPQPLLEIKWLSEPYELEIGARPNPLIAKFIEAALIGKGSLAGHGGIISAIPNPTTNPSWKRMLLTQPPVTHFAARVEYHYHPAWIALQEKWEYIADIGGITLCDLLEMLKSQHGRSMCTLRHVRAGSSDLWTISLATKDLDEYMRLAETTRDVTVW